MTDKSAAAIKEFAEKYGMTFKRHVPFSEPESHEQETVIKKDFLSDLTALISEHYVAKEEVDKMVSERLREYHLNEGYDVVIVGNPDKEIPGDIFEDIKVAALELGELRGLKVMITGFTANYLKTRVSHD